MAGQNLAEPPLISSGGSQDLHSSSAPEAADIQSPPSYLPNPSACEAEKKHCCMQQAGPSSSSSSSSSGSSSSNSCGIVNSTACTDKQQQQQTIRGGSSFSRTYQPIYKPSPQPSVSPDTGEAPGDAAAADAAAEEAAAAADTAADTAASNTPQSPSPTAAASAGSAPSAPSAAAAAAAAAGVRKKDIAERFAGGLGCKCSNPKIHKCLEKRRKEIEEEYKSYIPGLLAAEDQRRGSPCCELSSVTHTIVHVCSCMSTIDIDKALAFENLRLERIRDAYAVVLTLARVYGVEEESTAALKRRESNCCSTVYYQEEEEEQQQQQQQHHHHLHSSAADISRANSAVFTPQIDSASSGVSASLSEIEEELRAGMRRQFGFRSLGSLSQTPAAAPAAPAAAAAAAGDGAAAASWTLAAEEANGLKIFYRRHPNSTLLSFRIEGSVESNLLNIISVLNEMDLYKEWIPYYNFPLKLGLRDVKTLHRLGRVEQIDLLQLDFPWPMNNRDCCVDVWAADDLEYSNCFFVRITSLEGGTTARLPVAIPYPTGKTLRLYYEGAMFLFPVSERKTTLELLWCIDAKAYLSDYLLNFFAKVFAKSSFHSFCKVCSEASGGRHLQRREASPLLYEFVHKRLDEFKAMLARKKDKDKHHDKHQDKDYIAHSHSPQPCSSAAAPDDAAAAAADAPDAAAAAAADAADRSSGCAAASTAAAAAAAASGSGGCVVAAAAAVLAAEADGSAARDINKRNEAKQHKNNKTTKGLFFSVKKKD